MNYLNSVILFCLLSRLFFLLKEQLQNEFVKPN